MNDDSILSVDARITNIQADSHVRLAFVTPYSNGSTFNKLQAPAEGGIVFLIDSESEIHPFSEDSAGVYLPEDDHFAALTNRSYMLHIELPDGRMYQSEMEEMRNVPDIKGIWTVFENHEDESLDNGLNEGYRIFAKLETLPGEELFLKFDYHETWEAHLWGFEWYRIYLFHKEYNLSMGNTNFPEWPFDTIVSESCFRSFHPKRYLNIGKIDQNYVGDEFYHDLRFISLMDSRLSRKYSIE